MKLIIDPGHGGTDPGAVAYGYLEKDLNLVIAKRVYELLKNDFDVSLTRDKDCTLGPNPRARKVKNKYDYCISIHNNAGGGSGIETIHSIYSQNGKELAQIIAEELSKATTLPIRRVFSKKGNRGDYYYMHRLTGRTTTVIVECLFIDNLHNLEQLNIEKIAQAISRGFFKFMGKEV